MVGEADHGGAKGGWDGAMWLMTDRGFFSLIAYDREKARRSGLPDHDDPEQWLVVRTRAEADAKWAADRTRAEVFEIPGDYRFRLVVPRALWKEVVAEAIGGIEYGNFKNRVMDVQGIGRERVYARVWGDLLSLQD